MPHLRPTAKRNMHFIFIAAVVLLMSGSPTRSQQGHLIPSRPEQQYPIGFEVLNSLPDGVKFDAYLGRLYFNISAIF